MYHKIGGKLFKHGRTIFNGKTGLYKAVSQENCTGYNAV